MIVDHDAGLQLDELVEHWTVLTDEQELLAGRRGATKLGFTLLLKFYTRHGRFPSGRSELPDEAIEFVARQVQVPGAELGLYEWSGRTIEFHRSQIRTHLGFRECGIADADKLTSWLAEGIAQRERVPELVRSELLTRCRFEHIEPPTSKRIDRIVRSALHLGEQAMVMRVTAQLQPAIRLQLASLIVPSATNDDGADSDMSLLTRIKQAPGNVSLETMLVEIDKLRAVRAIGLPAPLFEGIPSKVVASWRDRAVVESPSHLRSHPDDLGWTLLAAMLHSREREIIGVPPADRTHCYAAMLDFT